MKRLAITALSIAALSLSACATYAPHSVEETPQKMSTSDMLFTGISDDKITTDGVSANNLSAQNPTCLTFYKNSASFIARPQGSKYAKSFGKTLALGMLAGAASGGVASMGIGSGFLEAALAGTANQVVFQGGNVALDKLGANVSDEDKLGLAARQIGCPEPDMATLKASKKAAQEAAKAMKKQAKADAKAAKDAAKAAEKAAKKAAKKTPVSG